jgi:hypothetical protein
MNAKERAHRLLDETDYFGRLADRSGIFAAKLELFIAALEEHGVLTYDAASGTVKTPARALAKAVERWQEEIDREWTPTAAIEDRAPGAAS